MEQRLKVARDIVLTCVVLHNMLRTHLRAPNPQDEVRAKVNEPIVFVADENCRNHSREAKKWTPTQGLGLGSD